MERDTKLFLASLVVLTAGLALHIFTLLPIELESSLALLWITRFAVIGGIVWSLIVHLANRSVGHKTTFLLGEHLLRGHRRGIPIRLSKKQPDHRPLPDSDQSRVSSEWKMDFGDPYFDPQHEQLPEFVVFPSIPLIFRDLLSTIFALLLAYTVLYFFVSVMMGTDPGLITTQGGKLHFNFLLQQATINSLSGEDFLTLSSVLIRSQAALALGLISTRPMSFLALTKDGSSAQNSPAS